MIDRSKVEDAIRGAPEQAAKALLAVQAGRANPKTLDGFKVAAEISEDPFEQVTATWIEKNGLLESFVLALQASGVVVETEELRLEDANWPARPLRQFLARGEAFRCRVRLNRDFSGSGCLVGPSLVMTAWHVIANFRPDAANPVYPPIEVELSDGQRARATKVYASTCTLLEYDGQLPKDDPSFKNFNDVALIKLDGTHGVRLGFAELPEPCVAPKSRSAILVLHFPQGNDVGYGFGKIGKYPGITYRYKHDVMTAAGSSGGPCFNTGFALAGLHQGKWAPDGRLVPAHLFADDLRDVIKADIAPPSLWSLDGTSNGPLVIGRDLFFQAVAASVKPESRLRGIRVKRLDPAQGTTGLAFSFDMLRLVLARNRGVHRTVRINFETPVADLLDEICRRAAIEGIAVDSTTAGAGSRTGETTLEAAVNDRARNLAARINTVAEGNGQLIWFVFETPSGGLTDAARFGFEAFVGAALHQPRLRLVLTGFETISTPGDEFVSAGQADGEGAPGFLVEYFGEFDRGAVEQMLKSACDDFGVSPDPAVITDRANQILQGLRAVNGRYSTADLKAVSDRAVQHLDYFKTQAGAQQ